MTTKVRKLNIADLLPKNDIFTNEGARACLGSGFCCSKAPCGIAMRKYGAKWTSPCPSLNFDGFRYWCAEYERVGPEVFLREAGGAGTGCSSPIGNEVRNAILKKIKEDQSE